MKGFVGNQSEQISSYWISACLVSTNQEDAEVFHRISESFGLRHNRRSQVGSWISKVVASSSGHHEFY